MFGDSEWSEMEVVFKIFFELLLFQLAAIAQRRFDLNKHLFLWLMVM